MTFASTWLWGRTYNWTPTASLIMQAFLVFSCQKGGSIFFWAKLQDALWQITLFSPWTNGQSQGWVWWSVLARRWEAKGRGPASPAHPNLQIGPPQPPTGITRLQTPLANTWTWCKISKIKCISSLQPLKSKQKWGGKAAHRALWQGIKLASSFTLLLRFHIPRGNCLLQLTWTVLIPFSLSLPTGWGVTVLWKSPQTIH